MLNLPNLAKFKSRELLILITINKCEDCGVLKTIHTGERHEVNKTHYDLTTKAVLGKKKSLYSRNQGYLILLNKKHFLRMPTIRNWLHRV